VDKRPGVLCHDRAVRFAGFGRPFDKKRGEAAGSRKQRAKAPRTPEELSRVIGFERE
jgi:hypothetical protein